MTIIYGVDTDKKVRPADVRDAIVECFTQAHSEALEDLKNYSSGLSVVEFEQLKRINVRQMVRNFFHETNGDYDHPTPESIDMVIEKLKEFAINFRDKEVVKKHFEEIQILTKKLRD